MNMYYVYILFSASLNTFYKGQTKDLSSRLERHNQGMEKSTKPGWPWRLVWSTQKENRAEAKSLERKLKNLSRQSLIEFILKFKEGMVNDQDDNFLDQAKQGSKL